MKVIKTTEDSAITNGIITVNNWSLAPNNCRYLYFYCDRWEILSDKMIPVEGFKSAEHWQLAAVNCTGDVIALFPGCQIKAWILCNKKPEKRDDAADCFYLR